MEKIVVHEMVHFLERHHNNKFLYYLDTFYPNWKRVKNELNALPVSHAEWE
jgi:predicted metal-dependent hydrolase